MPGNEYAMRWKKTKDQFVEYFSQAPIRQKLLLSFALFIVPVLFTGIISTSFSQKYLVESEQSYLKQSMSQLNNALDNFFEIYMDRMNFICMSNEMQSIIEAQVNTLAEAVDLNGRIQKTCGYLENDYRYPEIKNSFYYGGRVKYQLYLLHNIMYGLPAQPLVSIEKEKWYQEYAAESRAFKWQSGLMMNGETYISLSRRLVSFEDFQTKGLLQLYLPVQRIRRVIEANIFNKPYSVFYVNEDFGLITSVEKANKVGKQIPALIKKRILSKGIHQISIHGNRYLMGCLESTSTGWMVVYLTPLKQITKRTDSLKLIILVTVLVAFAMCELIAYEVASSINRRIQVLVRKSNMIGADKLETDLKLIGHDELVKLDRHFDLMIERINHLIKSEFESKIMMNQIRFELLQEQINPHLLYNTLAMLGYTAKKEGFYEIAAISNHLANLYKGILSKGKLATSFKEELLMVERYLEITKFVYQLNIDVIFELDDSILEFYTLKLLIQPIVENSIIHGIKPKGEGTLVINAVIQNDLVIITVSDDGIGMEPRVIQTLNNINSRGDIETGYGVGNVIKRMKLFFGDEYGIQVDSKLGQGTTTVIRVPLLTKEAMNDIMGRWMKV
jgi:two-component system, sensor histidine kinase YesM